MTGGSIARESWNPAQLPPPSLRIDGVLWAGVVAHLRAALPNEGCGLLAVALDDATRVTAFCPGDNVDASPTRFTMDPVAVLATDITVVVLLQMVDQVLLFLLILIVLQLLSV